MHRTQIIGVLLITVLLVLGACASKEASPPGEEVTPAAGAGAGAPPEETVSTPESTVMPNPLTTEEAIAMVRASPEMSKAVAPFKQELDWKAEWAENRWWVIGLFESPWDVKFVSDATILDGRVYAYIDYSTRPKREWVEAQAEEWRLQNLYTRLTVAEALARVKESGDVRYALRDDTIVDSVAELVEDSAISQAWRFAFYVLRVNGDYAVLVVEGYGGKGAKEGNYASDYGFGNATEVYREIPLYLLDWVRQLARDRDWEKAVNLP